MACRRIDRSGSDYVEASYGFHLLGSQEFFGMFQLKIDCTAFYRKLQKQLALAREFLDCRARAQK
jgi:hypothetical protein